MRRAVFETKQQLLNKLSAHSFRSGQQLAEELAISRAAIARHVKELLAYGVDIYSVKGKGYKLARPLDLIDREELAKAIAGCLPDGAQLHVYPLLDSTNQYWLERKQQQLVSGSACFAECQTAGRGRRGRQWLSPLGAALYFSMWWQSQSNISELMGLSVSLGLAITRWLNQLGVPAQVKWPNDIYVTGKKIAGILVELEALNDGRGQAVIGVGLNVKLPEESAATIDQPWTQLADHLDESYSRTALAAGLYQTIFHCMQQFEAQGLDASLEDWNSYDHFAEQPITLLMGQHRIEGICRGVDGHGALLVETTQGLKSFFGGEISIRGTYAAG